MKEFIKAFSLVFLAEMGDKSQLLALAFATTYPIGFVLSGISLGIILNHGLAILFAYLLSKYLGSLWFIHVFAGLLFLFFGFSSLKLDFEDEDEDVKPSKFGPILTMAGAFFLGELGDKTQLTAMTLALESDAPWIIFLGTVSSMILVSLIGILVGKLLGKKIPEITMQLLAGGLFLFFGTSQLYSLLPEQHQNMASLVLGVILILAIALYILRSNTRRKEEHFLHELASHYQKCRGCTIHNPQCPVALEINQLTEEYIGENIPFVGDIIRHIEGTKEIDEDKYEKLIREYYGLEE